MAINCKVRSLIVEAGAAFTPFQRKTWSSARQWGQKGDSFNCNWPPEGGRECSVCGASGSVKTGATMVLVFLLGDLAVGWIFGH